MKMKESSGRIEEENHPSKMEKEPLMSGSPIYQNCVVCTTRYQQGMSLSALHFHEFIEVSVVTERRGIHRIWNEVYPCTKGDVYVLNTGTPHGYFADGDNCPTVSNIIFDPADLLTGTPANPAEHRFCFGIFQNRTDVSHIRMNSRQLTWLCRISRTVQREKEEQLPEWQGVVSAEIQHLLIGLYRILSEQGPQKMPVKSEEKAMVSEVIRYIREHCADSSMTTEKIAANLYCSKATVSRTFHKVTGEYLADFIRSVRLDQACRLLRETNLDNKEIAALCGISDLSTFYARFKACFSVTPGVYREEWRRKG